MSDLKKMKKTLKTTEENVVDLSNQNLSNQDGLELLEIVRTNPFILTVNLEGNLITREIKDRIQALLDIKLLIQETGLGR